MCVCVCGGEGKIETGRDETSALMPQRFCSSGFTPRAAFPSSVTPGAEGNTCLDIMIGRLLKNLLPCADALVNENNILHLMKLQSH